MLEFAVFDLEEIALAGVNRYRTLLDRGGVEEACAHVRDHPRPQHDDEHLFGMVLTAALVAVGRGRRGEVLSAAFLVTWGLTYLTRLIARVVPAENASILDNFDSLRRFERAYPALGEELAAAVRLAPPEAGLTVARGARAGGSAVASRPGLGRVRRGRRAGSEAVGLEEAQPDLAARREATAPRARACRSAPRRRSRSSPRAATRRHRAAEGRADEHAPLLVDDEPRGAGRVAPVEAAAGRARRLEVDGAHVEPRLLRRRERVADGGDLRLGEDDPRRERAVARRVDARVLPRITSAAMRPWYLPMCVSSARPLTSPIA